MDKFLTTDQLEICLSEPTPGLLDTLRQHPGDILVLGVGGKMGPTLARMARRALDQLGSKDKVIGVARFSSKDLPVELEKHGVIPVACDLLNRQAVAKLPDAPWIYWLKSAAQSLAARRPALWLSRWRLTRALEPE